MRPGKRPICAGHALALPASERDTGASFTNRVRPNHSARSVGLAFVGQLRVEPDFCLTDNFGCPNSEHFGQF